MRRLAVNFRHLRKKGEVIMRKHGAFLIVCAIVMSLSFAGQTVLCVEEGEAVTRSYLNPIRGRHSIELGIGLLSKVRSMTDVSSGNTITESEANGFIGSITYTHWLEENVAVHITTGALDVDAVTVANGSETFVEASTVVPLLFGVEIQPYGKAISHALRPYISASVGPYFGFTSDAYSGNSTCTTSYTETTLGARLGGGVDLALSRYFSLGIGAGYHFVDDFNRRIGTETNYSGPDFSLSFGVVFGSGR
jgi:hypothetical protein